MKSGSNVWICALVVSLAGCNQGGPKQNSHQVVSNAAAATLPRAPAPVPSAEPTPPAPAPAAPRVELEITAKASTMTYDKASLTVPAGSEVHLVMKNSKPGALSHNWVLVNPGKEAAVAAAGLPAGPAGNYLTPGPDVLAFTPLAQPGTDTEVTFKAPAVGTYPYICSFPGHYMMMKGTLTVTP